MGKGEKTIRKVVKKRRQDATIQPVVVRKRVARSSIPGFSRRRRYRCSICLNQIWEFPGLVVGNGFDLVCDDCKQQRDKNEEERKTFDATAYPRSVET